MLFRQNFAINISLSQSITGYIASNHYYNITLETITRNTASSIKKSWHMNGQLWKNECTYFHTFQKWETHIFFIFWETSDFEKVHMEWREYKLITPNNSMTETILHVINFIWTKSWLMEPKGVFWKNIKINGTK